tara:strand:- start:189 stop:368 length:180 start_codon:yes stop_codon:yes gene_type:complete
MDELEELKPQSKDIEMERWNIEDLELYVKNLHDEIDKVNQILKSKKGVTDSAAALFNNQ